MAYDLRFTAPAAKQFGRLDAPVQRRVRTFLGTVLAEPRAKGEALSGPEHLWRYRVGAYRIIVSISDVEVEVLVVRLGSRGQVYRDQG